MKYRDLVGFKGSLKDLDAQLSLSEDKIKEELADVLGTHVSGVKLRVSTATVPMSADGAFYLYERTPGTPQQGELRGKPGKLDTPKGIVPFVGAGKWNTKEDEIVGEVVAVELAHEYNAAGQFAEFVLMPTYIFKVDTATEAYLTANLSNVHEKLAGVGCYQWTKGPFTSENSMTKVLAAAHALANTT